jgi:hypothetical protein
MKTRGELQPCIGGARWPGTVLARLVLLALALVLASPDGSHAHRSDTPGLYDAHCPLAELAARRGDASLPSTPPAVSVPYGLDAAPVISAARFAQVPVADAVSRAPPVLS